MSFLQRFFPLTYWQSFWLAGGAAIGIVLIILASVWVFMPSNEPGPQEVFERFLALTDQERFDEARSLVDPFCSDTDEGMRAALEDLRSVGLDFKAAFRVEEVWINGRGTRALLELTVPPQLPLPGVASLDRTDDGWVLSCQ